MEDLQTGSLISRQELAAKLPADLIPADGLTAEVGGVRASVFAYSPIEGLFYAAGERGGVRTVYAASFDKKKLGSVVGSVPVDTGRAEPGLLEGWS